MHPVTLCVTFKQDAERPGRRSRAERGNDQGAPPQLSVKHEEGIITELHLKPIRRHRPPEQVALH
ncbi:hypothetical protein ACTGV9_12625, partial [Streptococcus suis]